jgi:glycine hydroxymethyltransferase
MGDTHKTIPGPTCALIMMQNMELARKIENKINPMYLRNTQMHQKMSLILTLLEMEYFGQQYVSKTIENAQILASNLSKRGFNVLNHANGYTRTHQIHFSCTKNEMNYFYDNCTFYNVTLNFKTKRLFDCSGIRIGTQEVSRYNWGEDDMKALSEILYAFMQTPRLYEKKEQTHYIQQKLNALTQKKEIHFTFKTNDYDTALYDLFQ